MQSKSGQDLDNSNIEQDISEDFEEEEDDEIEMPHFVTATTLEEDEAEIEYYAKKLGIDPEYEEWDDDLIRDGYSKILKGITSAQFHKKISKEEPVKLVKGVRDQNEESARKDFTGLLNRIAPSNFGDITRKIREAFASYEPQVSINMFTRCLTQRIKSDAQLPPIFLDCYARVLQELPDAIPSVLSIIKSLPEDNLNAKPFLDLLPHIDDFEIQQNDKQDLKGIKDEKVAQCNAILRQMHMTTDVRHDVCLALLNALDVSDACGRIGKLGLSKSQKTEIPMIIIECCRRETPYNPYYAAVAYQLNDHHFKSDLNSAVKKTLKIMEKMSSKEISNTALFCETMIEKQLLDLNFLKGSPFATFNKQQVAFLTLLLKEYFLRIEIETIQSQMTLIKQSSPNFANDLGNFINLKVISFCKKVPTFPEDRIRMITKITELLQKL